MLVLKPRQRELLAEKLLDTANLALGGLIFGQFVSGAAFSIPLGVLGIALWTLFAGLGTFLARGEAW